MKKTLEVKLEIVYFECKDIITTSTDHDNTYTDSGTLAYLIQDIKSKLK